MSGDGRADLDRLICELGRLNDGLVNHYHVVPIAEVETVELLDDLDLARAAVRETFKFSLKLAQQLRGI